MQTPESNLPGPSLRGTAGDVSGRPGNCEGRASVAVAVLVESICKLPPQNPRGSLHIPESPKDTVIQGTPGLGKVESP